MSEKTIEKPNVDVKSPTEQTPVFKPNENDGGSVVEQMKRMYRAKPLIVSACPTTDGWTVEHGGMTLTLTNKQFTGMYEVLDVGGDVIDAGLPDLDPGAEIERDGKRLVRVTVHAGSGAIAYWKDMKRFGSECEFRVTADMIDNVQASHRVGKFVEPWVGKSGERTWVVKES